MSKVQTDTTINPQSDDTAFESEAQARPHTRPAPSSLADCPCAMLVRQLVQQEVEAALARAALSDAELWDHYFGDGTSKAPLATGGTYHE